MTGCTAERGSIKRSAMMTINLKPPEHEMNLIEASAAACREPTLVAALTWIAVWETERVVKQARDNMQWETCFRVCFEQVTCDWAARHRGY